MRKTNFAILILILIILMNCQTIFSQGKSFNVEKSKIKQCSLFTEDLEFCVKSPIISVNSNENVTLLYSVKNLTEREITIPYGGRGVSRLLQLIITDETGNKIPTIKETLTEKFNNNTISAEESKKFVGFLRGSGPLSSDFDPKEESSCSWNLSYLYDFKNKGKYFVEIYKREVKQSENISPKILLGKVEIEIK